MPAVCSSGGYEGGKSQYSAPTVVSSHASFASPSSAVGRTSSSSEASVSKTGCAIHREPSACSQLEL